MERTELEIVAGLWHDFFPKDKFYPQDERVTGVKLFLDFFKTDEGNRFIENTDLTTAKSVYFSVDDFSYSLPFNDFEHSLRMRPIEVIGCIGIALGVYVKVSTLYLEGKYVIQPRFYGLHSELAFSDLKSSTVGQLVTMTGHVIRVSACRPLVQSACFLCPKCMSFTESYFEDGIFMPPAECATPR